MKVKPLISLLLVIVFSFSTLSVASGATTYPFTYANRFHPGNVGFCMRVTYNFKVSAAYWLFTGTAGSYGPIHETNKVLKLYRNQLVVGADNIICNNWNTRYAAGTPIDVTIMIVDPTTHAQLLNVHVTEKYIMP